MAKNRIFKIDGNNNLTYEVKSSVSSPKQLKLTGSWSLDNKHNLTLKLDKPWQETQGNKIHFNAEIINARENMLEFSASGKDYRGETHFYILRLSGRWQADKYNRLNFMASKSRGEEDKLTLSSSWQINKQNELVYNYTKQNLETRNKTSHSLTFNGCWDICDRSRLLYTLNKETNSGFSFKVRLGKPDKKGLKYEIGIGKKKKTLTLYGAWKLNSRLGLIFEMPYAKSGTRSLVFGADCKLNKDYTLEARLKNSLQEDLGINLRLSRSIFSGQGEMFLRALKENKEMSILAGLGLKW